MLPAQQRQALVTSFAVKSAETSLRPKPWRCRGIGNFSIPRVETGTAVQAVPPHEPVIEQPSPAHLAQEIDPLYLFACHIEWESRQEPTAAWELIAAAQSPNSDSRAQARALLTNSHHFGGPGTGLTCEFVSTRKRPGTAEADMKAPYGLDIVDNCTECTQTNPAFFCAFSNPVLKSLDHVSHKSVLPAGAILFVEGQEPRGLFIICSGKVNLSTTSREGKILILKTAMPGEVLGLSATVSGMNYEITAETATPCQLSFIDRKRFLELMESHSETGLHTAQCLSRDYQSASRDIHDLVLTRSSVGKLARLLLSHASAVEMEDGTRVTQMTHEEMAQRIGASRETVTRLLTRLRRKRLIRLDGPNLVIRDRSALEAIAT